MLFKLTISSLLLCGAFVAGGKVTSADPQDEKEMEKVMAAYEKAATPNELHKGLTSWAGKWEQKGEFPMGTWNGTVNYKPILGGRFVLAETTASMKVGDKPMEFEALQILGYDNVLKQYQTIWLDTMGTGMYFSPGTADASGKTVTYEAPAKDALTPQGRPFKVVITVDGPDKHTVELWDSKKDGKTLVKEGTIVETRVK
jgi:hypothetical protein